MPWFKWLVTSLSLWGAWIWSQTSPCEVRAGQKSHWNRFSSKYFSFPFSIIPSIIANTHLHLHITLIRQANRQNLGTFQKEVLFQKLGKQWIQIYFHFLFTCRSQVVERANYWIKSQWSCLLLDQLPIRTTVFPITESSSGIYCCTDRNGNPLTYMY